MQTSEILRAWGKILKGDCPSLSIEITRECPLRCPGCYAYEDGHLGGGVTLRELNDRKGKALIDGVLELVDRLKPLHLSIVGGDPLVRYRELETMVPLLLDRGIHVQVVTSAFRPLAREWADFRHMNVVVSIDGLQPEHDVRRAPATYDRILKNIAGQHITIHSTVTGQMMKRPGYLNEFMEFWTPRPEIAKVWFSLFTPQRGDDLPGNADETRARPGDRSVARDAPSFPEAGYARRAHPAACVASAQPGGVRVCFDHANDFGRSQNENHALSIRGRSRLRVLRLHRVYGTFRRRCPQIRRLHPSRGNF